MWVRRLVPRRADGVGRTSDHLTTGRALTSGVGRPRDDLFRHRSSGRRPSGSGAPDDRTVLASGLDERARTSRRQAEGRRRAGGPTRVPDRASRLSLPTGELLVSLRTRGAGDPTRVLSTRTWSGFDEVVVVVVALVVLVVLVAALEVVGIVVGKVLETLVVLVARRRLLPHLLGAGRLFLG